MNETTETSRSDFRYKRVLLKISGEALMGDTGFGIDMATCDRFARGIAASVKAGAEICLVIGGGNIFAAWRARLREWSAHRQTIWACWRPL